MSRIPVLVEAELIGVPLYLHNKIQEAKNPQERRIAILETGIWKAFVTLKSMGNVFTDRKIAQWGGKLKMLLDYPGAPWNSSRRLEILEKETGFGIELLETSISSPVLKQLRDLLIAIRDENICKYYQQILEEEAGITIQLPFESEFHNQQPGGAPMK
ncbi:MAG: hypothetical protein WC082_11020 [Victivallales bacterium]